MPVYCLLAVFWAQPHLQPGHIEQQYMFSGTKPNLQLQHSALVHHPVGLSPMPCWCSHASVDLTLTLVGSRATPFCLLKKIDWRSLVQKSCYSLLISDVTVPQQCEDEVPCSLSMNS